MVVPLAMFGLFNLVFLIAIVLSTVSQGASCADIGGNWDHEKNICSIISQCLNKGGCYALPVPGLLPRDQPWCLFGEDITPEACYDSQSLRESFGP